VGAARASRGLHLDRRLKRPRLPADVVGNTLEEHKTMCSHTPSCPETTAADCCTAQVVADRSDQGWCQLCNGVIRFDDGHYLTPDGHDHVLSA
jgi:hypothetical protein